jgi:hypothetical protein
MNIPEINIVPAMIVYLAAGSLVLLQQVFRSKTSEEMTFVEGTLTVLMWPLIMIIRIAISFIDNFNKILERI